MNETFSLLHAYVREDMCKQNVLFTISCSIEKYYGSPYLGKAIREHLG